mmetsp:Transcript_53176/g.129120  ORF Transcript_53176/g.129120 Transcript_53176/m.129120 type:complete len:366 (+) Transcript_53176:138-1235(+)
MQFQATTYMNPVQNAAQDKINRELFVGNTPPGTTELLLLHFCTAAMRRANLCAPNETPILSCRVSQKFSFIETSSPDMANRALNLNGIPFLGALLKVSRPSKYIGPNVPAQTWQQLTGQNLPPGAVVDPEQEKISRELFVGNTTPEMTEQMLREFLGNAMEQVGLNSQPGNPITNVRVSGKFAFAEFRSKEEATNAINLNNIPFMGAQLRIGRPSKWQGPPDTAIGWEGVLAKYLSGELTSGQGAGGAAAPPPPPPAVPAGPPPSKVVELKNMLSDDDLVNPEEYNDIMEDTREECGQFGSLVSVIIPKAGEPGATKIFLEYSSPDDAAKAIAALQGRTFDGRRVHASYYDEARFASKDYAGTSS